MLIEKPAVQHRLSTTEVGRATPPTPTHRTFYEELKCVMMKYKHAGCKINVSVTVPRSLPLLAGLIFAAVMLFCCFAVFS